eukprot:251863-Chlamydomonas_euryale.AAC.4
MFRTRKRNDTRAPPTSSNTPDAGTAEPLSPQKSFIASSTMGPTNLASCSRRAHLHESLCAVPRLPALGADCGGRETRGGVELRTARADRNDTDALRLLHAEIVCDACGVPATELNAGNNVVCIAVRLWPGGCAHVGVYVECFMSVTSVTGKATHVSATTCMA